MATPCMETPPPIRQDPRDDAPVSGAALRTVDSVEILRGSLEVAIAHNGRVYRLRQTRNGKLILT